METNITDTEQPYKNTRCFIDCDGTLTNSLKYYNVVIDELFLGKLSDKKYNEYYKEFGDEYEIIPGAPWKTILAYLIDYLARHDGKLGNEPVDKISNATFAEAAMRIAFDTAPIPSSCATDGMIMLMKSGNASYAVMPSDTSEQDMLDALDNMPDASLKRIVTYDREGFERVPFDGCFVNVPSFIDEVISIDSVIDIIVERFENGFVELIENIPDNDLAIAPVIEFCREYKNCGGTLIIHSGTNKRIVDAMLDKLGIAELFTDKLCTNMLGASGPETDSPWGYKIDLLGKLLDKYPVNGTKDFVVGDTKGDAFGAHELGLPFVLVWRGYPKDPVTLHGDNGIEMSPNVFCDFRQELLDECNDPEVYRDDIDEMLEFAKTL